MKNILMSNRNLDLKGWEVMNDLIRKKDVANWMFENRMCTSLNNAYGKLKELPMVDLADHNQQIRDETVDEFVSKLKKISEDCYIDNYCEDTEFTLERVIDSIAKQMKGERNENSGR